MRLLFMMSLRIAMEFTNVDTQFQAPAPNRLWCPRSSSPGPSPPVFASLVGGWVRGWRGSLPGAGKQGQLSCSRPLGGSRGKQTTASKGPTQTKRKKKHTQNTQEGTGPGDTLKTPVFSPVFLLSLLRTGVKQTSCRFWGWRKTPTE